MKNIMYKIILIIIAVLILTAFSYSQAGRGIGRLKGNVTDMNNKPLTGAKVSLRFLEEDGDDREVYTDKKGEWAFIGLGYGKYDLTAEKEGFDTLTKRILVSQMNRNPFTNLKLKVSKRAELKKELASVDKGLELFKEKKYEEALVFFNQFLSKYPEKTEINLFIGNCLKEMKKYEEARLKYILVTSEGNSRYNKKIAARGFAGLGELYVLQNDLKGARFYFENSIRLNPNDEILAYNVGEIYFANNNPDGAIQYYKLAAEIKPDWPVPHVKLGYVYLNKGDIAGAKSSFQRFLELDQESAEAETIREILKSL